MTAEYSVIRFSPSPETVEAVNVALVFWEPAPRVVFDPKFPRLSCIEPGIDPDLLAFYLRDLEGRLTDPLERETSSAQLVLGEPRRIVSPITSELEKALWQKFLQRGSAPVTAMSRERVQPYIDSQLHQFLVERVGVSESNIRRRATPSEFLSPEVVRRHFSENSLSIARVIVGSDSLVVTDGIHRGQQNVGQIEQRASKIGSAFYRLQKAKEDILRLDKRRLYRAVVLFGKARQDRAARLEYVEVLLRRDSDFQEEASAPSDEFIRVAREATQGLF